MAVVIEIAAVRKMGNSEAEGLAAGMAAMWQDK